MNKIRILAWVVLLSGVVFLIVGALEGDFQGGFILIFPFFIGSGVYAIVGVLLLMLSFFLFILGFTPKKLNQQPPSPQDQSGQKPIVKGGGIILVGPIPILFGSSWKIALALILATVLLSVLVYFLFYHL